MKTKPISRLIKNGSVLAAAALFSPMQSHASALVPGSVLTPAAPEPDPTSGTIIDSNSTNFTVVGAFSGTLRTLVVEGDPSNPLGGLTFVYEIVNDGVAGLHSIGRMSIQGFSGFATDCSYQTSLITVAPAMIDRNVSGDVIGFNFLPTPLDPRTGFLTPGNTTSVLVVQTDASSYTNVTASLLDGRGTSVTTYGPARTAAALNP